MGMIPLRPGSKVPTCRDWTRRKFPITEIRKHIAEGGNVGWALEANDLIIDVDPRHGGKEALARLMAELQLSADDLRRYPRTVTGGGGLHIWMTLAAPLNGAPVVLPGLTGLEFKRAGSQVVIPPSVHPDTKLKYKYASDSKPKYPAPAAPQCLIGYILAHCHKADTFTSGQAAKGVPRLDLGLVAELLAHLDPKDFDANDRWFPILAATHDATGGSKEGLGLFIDWSLSDPAYADHEPLIRARWNSLGRQDRANLITLRTLVAEAARSGVPLDADLAARVEFGTDTVPAEPPSPPAGEGKKDNINDIGYKIALYVRGRVFGGFLIHAADQQYWTYVGTHWEPVSDNMIDSALLDGATAYLSRAKKCKTAVSTLMSQARTVLRALCATRQDLLGVNGLQPVLNCSNGEIHVAKDGTFEFRPHRPESYLSTVLKVEYDPEAKCPLFDKSLSEIFVNEQDTPEVVRHFWEVMGYCLQPYKNIAMWLLFNGNGNNGKSLVLDTFTKLWGDTAIEKAINSLDLSKNNHALADIPRRLAIIDDDYKYDEPLPDSELKKLSENKMLSANPKNRATFRFMNTAIAIISSNKWPITRDLSDGLRRRAMVFNFSKHFTKEEEDLELRDKVVPELSGILNNALAGYLRLRTRGQFDVPKACLNAKHLWYSHSNQILQFIEEVKMSEESSSGKESVPAPFDDIWTVYEIWTNENRVKNKYTRLNFRKALESLGYVMQKGKVLNFELNYDVYSNKKPEKDFDVF